MICPRTGEAFLDEANRLLKPQRPRNILICDKVRWHKCKSNAWGLFERLFLPAYSPDFNPIEEKSLQT